MTRILIITLFLFIEAYSQEIPVNKFGLPVINEVSLYEKTIISDSTKLLVDLEDYIDKIFLDIRYSTKNNFYGEPVYNEAKAFLRKNAADSLRKLQAELLVMNKSLKIYDAYRPYSVTLLFYEKIKDTNFVASAWTGSRHNRGCAVDLTIVELSTGKEIKMPTAYDDFTEKAAIDYPDVTDEEKANRELLQRLMIKYGFIPYKSEWWHFDFTGWKYYELTDINFNILKNVYFKYKEVN